MPEVSGVTESTGDPTLATGRTASQVCEAAHRTYSGIVYSPHIPNDVSVMPEGKVCAVETPSGVLLAVYEGGGTVDYVNPHNIK